MQFLRIVAPDHTHNNMLFPLYRDQRNPHQYVTIWITGESISLFTLKLLSWELEIISLKNLTHSVKIESQSLEEEINGT